MAVDIKNLNHNQLNDLIAKAQIRQDELRKEKVAKLREKVHALIKAEGYSFDDIFGGQYAWTVTLTKSPLGNAPSSETDAF